MRSLASFALQICWALPVRFSVSAQRFDYLETGSYDLFAPTDLGDQLVESDFPPPDPLASNDFSPFTDPLTYSDVSTPLSPGSDFLADSSSLGCSSSDFTQDPLIGKRLEDEKPQLCLPQRSNPDKYPGFDPEDDPLLKVNVFEPEDEEFCPRHLYSPSFLICDSGYFIDRGRNPLTAVWHLNRCERSMNFRYSFSFCLPLCWKYPPPLFFGRRTPRWR